MKPGQALVAIDEVEWRKVRRGQESQPLQFRQIRLGDAFGGMPEIRNDLTLRLRRGNRRQNANPAPGYRVETDAKYEAKS